MKRLFALVLAGMAPLCTPLTAQTRVDYPTQLKRTPTIDPRTYGATGNGTTDDTTAISNAIAASLSVAYANPPCIVFPQGTYKVSTAGSAVFQVSSNNVCIEGDTPWNTIINSTSSAPIFNLGTFSSTQSPPWVRNAEYFTLRNITIENASMLAPSNTGSRVTTGVQSNGNGHVTMENVQFQGLKYGFVAPYGSDFDRFRNIWTQDNDVGIYMGPSSEQFSIVAFHSAVSGEGIVCDGCAQGAVHDSTFEDHMTAAITFEREEPTRFGWNPASIGSYDAQSNVAVQNNWFESGAGNSGITTWQEYYQVLLQASAGLTSYPRHIIIRDNYMVAGSTGIAAKDMNVHSILGLTSGKYTQLHNTDIAGNRLDAVVFADNSNNAVETTNVIVEDGYSAVPTYNVSGGAFANNLSYNPAYLNKGFEPIPTSCATGDQLYYDYTITTWAGCVAGAFSYFAQLDGTLHIPNSLLPTSPAFSTITVNGATTLNAILGDVYAGTSGSNDGYWQWQNSGSPTTRVAYSGYDSSNVQQIKLDPSSSILSGGATGGLVESMAFQGSGVTFANLGTPAAGVMVWCSNCTVANPCTGAGSGAWAFRTAAAAWNCPF